MADAPATIPLGASTLNRDWRLEVDAAVNPGVTGAATATANSPTLALTSHGLQIGQEVTVTGTPPAGFTAGTTYYVIAAGFASGTFQLSATPGGTAVTPTAAGTVNFVRGSFWMIVRGRTDMKPGLDNTLQDDSDLDSGGFKSSTKTASQWMLEFKLARKIVPGTSGYDPGQEIIRVAGDQSGPANSLNFRWCKLGPVRVEAYRGAGAVDWAPEGGGMDGLDTVAVKITGQGARVAIPHPYTLP